MGFIDELKKQNPNNKYYDREISEKAEQLIDNMLAEIQEMRERLANDIRNGDLPLETYDFDDRCKELIRREELMYYVLDKVKYGIMREDVVEALENMDKPIEMIAEHLENNDYIAELQNDEYDLAVMKATDKYKELDFEKE